MKPVRMASDSGLSRRALLGGAVSGATVIWLGASAPTPVVAARRRDPWRRTLGRLDERIERGMERYGVPGAAVGVVLGPRTYVRGYGVTNLDHPTPVDADTVFRINSTTKTFTGTTAMRLVEQGRLNLDARVRDYLPDFATSDPAVAEQVTVRQLLNHSPGWLGDFHQDFGSGDDALARYVAAMPKLPQLTPTGTVFSYNNAAICVAGRVIEAVTGMTFENAVKHQVLEPLALRHSRFFSDEIIGFNIAAGHTDRDGKPVVNPSSWFIPRAEQATGGLISSVADQVRWARFHLGDGRTSRGTRLLSPASMREMQSRPGPGGTLVVELTGMGVTWMQRPTAEGPMVIQHGGSGAGQYSGFLLVPRRRFGLTLLTNGDGGSGLRNELFTDDWALRAFAGVSNLPAKPFARPAAELAAYEGTYTSKEIGERGQDVPVEFDLRARGGRLHGTNRSGGSSSELGMAFYSGERVLDLGPEGNATGVRSDFIRAADGSVAWLRTHGRLYRRQR